MMIYGYLRISDASQNSDGQLSLLEQFGCDEIVRETISGIAEEKELNALVKKLNENDVVVVTRIDRLGRSARQIITLVEELNEKKADLVILDLGIDTRTVGGKMVLTIMASVAEYERSLLKEKQRIGIEAAKRAGKHLGREARYTKEALNEAVIRYENGGLTYADIERLYNIPSNSFYRALKKHREKLVISKVKM